jgi:hypothetical protein
VTTAAAGRLRAAAVAVGGAGVVFGLWQLVIVSPQATRPVSAVAWLAGSLVVHDGLLAPAALVVALLLTRRLSGRVRRVVGVGLFVAVCVVLVALPALLGPGVGDNPSATPRNYGAGLLAALGVVAVGTGLAVVVVRVRAAPRR